MKRREIYFIVMLFEEGSSSVKKKAKPKTKF